MKGLEELSETIRQLSIEAQKGIENVDKLKDVLKGSQIAVLESIKDEKEKEKYKEFSDLGNDLIEKCRKNQNIGEMYESIEMLKNYGK
jgi:hypothetical protein|tara:strand:- start:400 stop:663 length:264 start_codon:yes stop_codon:yes gene_type:complete